MEPNRIPVKGTFWQSAHHPYYMYIFKTYIHVLFKKCYFRTVQNLLVRFDENTDTDQLFVWNEVQVKNNKLQDLEELFLQKRNMSSKF